MTSPEPASGPAPTGVRPAPTPDPPYTAVIFTSVRSDVDDAGYATTDARLTQLAARQPGYLGLESAHTPGGFGITVSYWASAADAQAWKSVAEHRLAQRRGRDEWYASYRVRVATVERAYGAD